MKQAAHSRPFHFLILSSGKAGTIKALCPAAYLSRRTDLRAWTVYGACALSNSSVGQGGEGRES